MTNFNHNELVNHALELTRQLPTPRKGSLALTLLSDLRLCLVLSLSDTHPEVSEALLKSIINDLTTAIANNPRLRTSIQAQSKTKRNSLSIKNPMEQKYTKPGPSVVSDMLKKNLLKEV